MTTKQKPAHNIKLGRIKAAIWANQSEKGGTRYNVTVCRIYKTGDAWKQSSSFGRDELPLLMKVLDMSHMWMFEQGEKAES